MLSLDGFPNARNRLWADLVCGMKSPRLSKRSEGLATSASASMRMPCWATMGWTEAIVQGGAMVGTEKNGNRARNDKDKRQTGQIVATRQDKETARYREREIVVKGEKSRIQLGTAATQSFLGFLTGRDSRETTLDY